MRNRKNNLEPSASNAPTYPNKFDAKMYVEKRAANDICMYVYGRELGLIEEIRIINGLYSPEEVVDRAMKRKKYFNVVKNTFEVSDERYLKFNWWQVLDEDEVERMADDALFLSFDQYVELYNLTELAQ